MPTFRYDAKDSAGRAASGTLEANDASAAAAMLFDQGRIPIRIVAAGGRASGDAGARPANSAAARNAGTRSAAPSSAPAGDDVMAGLLAMLPPALRPLPRKRVSDVELQLMTRELQAMLKAGVPILRALALLQDSAANPALAAALGRLSADLDSGLELATAMERESQRSRLFAPYYVSIVKVAEATGRLEQGLARLAKHLQFLRVTREQVTAALRYPMFVILAAVIAISIVNIFVIPQFEKVFKGMKAQLPPLTEFLLGSSKLFVHGWPVLLLLVIGGVVGYRMWAHSPKGAEQRDRLMLAMPIVGDILKRTSLARFATSFATALQSGVPVAQALTIVSETIGNLPYANAVEAMRTRVERGEALRVAVGASGLFPPVLQQVISVGEETGALDELLGEIGEHYQSEVEYAISRLSARIEPILIVVLGAIVLVLALGVFMPMWEMGRASMGRS